MQSFNLSIANLQVRFEAPFEQPRLSLPKAYETFLTHPKSKPHWAFEIQYGFIPSLAGQKLVYDTKESWALFEANGSFWFTRPSPARGPSWTILQINPQEKQGLLFLKKGAYFPGKGFPLFAHPIDQLLFGFCFSCEPVLIVHACGVCIDDFGYAFLGHSGFGKSTLARLLGKVAPKAHPPLAEPGTHLLLSDDRLIIAKQEKAWRLFGTPWHGDAKIYSNASAPLKEIFFLKHGLENSLKPLSPAVSAAKLFAMSFPVLWDPGKRNHAIQIASQIACEIPCHEFAFLPNLSAVDFIKKSLRLDT